MLIRDIGNVTMDTEITFEYTLKPTKDLAKMDDIDFSAIKQLPFQTQITYKALDGNVCIRVITEQMDISNDREEVEKKADMNILGTRVI